MQDQDLDIRASEDEHLQHTGVLYSAADALKPPPTLHWCVQGLFAQPTFSMLVGDPGSKKTFLAIDLAVCVALGKPWLGHPVEQAPALFIDEQTGPINYGRVSTPPSTPTVQALMCRFISSPWLATVCAAPKAPMPSLAAPVR